MEDGTVIKPEEFIGPTIKGRKVTILGDTKDSSEMIPICQNSDIIVHEATNENSLASQAIEHGHSTPEMAAKFALESKANMLCLTHVSPRYRPKANISPNETIVELSAGISKDVQSTRQIDSPGEIISDGKSDGKHLFADQLKNEANEYIKMMKGSIDVLVAEDFMTLPVVRS